MLWRHLAAGSANSSRWFSSRASPQAERADPPPLYKSPRRCQPRHRHTAQLLRTPLDPTRLHRNPPADTFLNLSAALRGVAGEPSAASTIYTHGSHCVALQKFGLLWLLSAPSRCFVGRSTQTDVFSCCLWRNRTWFNMNVFRLAGDVSHVVAIIVLFVKIWRSRSCAGRSGAGGGLWAWGLGCGVLGMGIGSGVYGSVGLGHHYNA